MSKNANRYLILVDVNETDNKIEAAKNRELVTTVEVKDAKEMHDVEK